MKLTSKDRKKLNEKYKAILDERLAEKGSSSGASFSSRDLTEDQIIELLKVNDKLLGITKFTSDEKREELKEALKSHEDERLKAFASLNTKANIKKDTDLTDEVKEAGVTINDMNLTFDSGERKVFSIIEKTKQLTHGMSTQVIVRDTVTPLDGNLLPKYSKDDIVISAPGYMPFGYGYETSTVYNTYNKARELEAYDLTMKMIIHPCSTKGMNLGDPKVFEGTSEFEQLYLLAKRIKLSKADFKDAFKELIGTYKIDKLVDAIYEKLESKPESTSK